MTVIIDPARYDAVIFDLDGVITDTASVHAAAWRWMFDEFLTDRSRPEQLIESVHTVAAGEALLSPAVTRTVIDRMTRTAPPDPARQRRLRDLTPRERDVLEQLARGRSNAEIAAALVVEESTVKTHVKRIMSKLDLRDRVQAVILGYETGLVRPGESPDS